MKLGFTGTREGMSDAQRAAFGVLVVFDAPPTVFRHGSCQGSDVEAARIVRHVRRAACRILCHPGPPLDRCRAASGVDDEVLPAKTHLARNRDIVDLSDGLIATPKDMTHSPRGGTWYTVDYAKKRGKPVWIIWPDGRVEKIEPLATEAVR